jgi:phospholipase C
MSQPQHSRPGLTAITMGALGAVALLGGMATFAPLVNAEEEARRSSTATPIKHVVVIFQENVSFDHYFATYPHADNAPGEPVFKAKRRTPTANTLQAAGLLAPNNPNSVQPFRLTRAQANTCDQDHGYTDEQKAFNNGEMNKFVESVGIGGGSSASCKDYGHGTGIVMGYYDGNTVTALWHYAQHFAMSDNSFGTTFGPSSPGALNLVAGQTHGANPPDLPTAFGPDTVAGSVISDPQPFFDDCSTRETVMMGGRNVGDLLVARNVTWGFFQGGFSPSTPATGSTKAKCATSHTGSDGNPKGDYIPHHQPFQYYASTANPKHLPPSAVPLIGHSDQANHQYDLADFWAAVDSGNMPAVSYLKAPGFQDGHAGYSDPLLEQTFLVETINRLQKRPEWKDMAIIVAYDDSDGWYDHVPGPIVNGSETADDAAICNGQAPQLGTYQGRCGYGPRLPLLVISPFAKKNYVDHTLTDQSSILRFIEDNWNLGRIGDHSFDQIAGSLLRMFDFGKRREITLILDPSTGQKTSANRVEDDDSEDD